MRLAATIVPLNSCRGLGSLSARFAGVLMSDSSELDSLNSVKYLYLRELSEPRDNSLRIIVDEAVGNRSALGPARPELPELAEILKNSWPIESTASCKTFELFWKYYIAYLVTEECVGSCGSYDDEVYTGGLFRVYAKSHFLEHLARDTGAHVEPIQHFKLVCLNHVIDIASYRSPEIRLIDPSTPKSARIQ
jgi:hypothetical protein